MTKALQSEIDQIKAELEAMGEEETPTQEKEEEQEQQAEEEKKEETPEPEPTEQEEKKEEEPPAKPEKEPDASGYRRLRLEKDAEKKRADALEARIRELEAKQAQPKQQEEEILYENTAQPDPELEQIKLENRYNAAQRALQQMEMAFRENGPDDYDDVAAQYAMTIQRSIALENPDLDAATLAEATRRKVLEIAANHKARGYDPVERIYLDGKKMGFKAFVREQETQEKPVAKPDLTKVAANMKRNAGTAGAKGAGQRGQMTAAALAELPAHEYAKIPPAERKRILESLPRE